MTTALERNYNNIRIPLELRYEGDFEGSSGIYDRADIDIAIKKPDNFKSYIQADPVPGNTPGVGPAIERGGNFCQLSFGNADTVILYGDNNTPAAGI